MPETLIETARAKIHAVWGYTQFRPLQKEAISAALQGRDSLVVLPTGGGKSLCYQVPALLSDRLTVVLSPLISLMKDQVDRLLSHGIQAAFLNSSLDFSDQRRVRQGVAQGKYQLLFVAPERMQDEGFVKLLDSANVGLFAIDEAHCISHWGHDFREDYRHLDQLKKRFPDASVHAFTATATPRVRSDILQQLGLTNPEVLVGDFFRSNLQYQVSPRTNIHDDIRKELDKRPGQTGIIYCIRRADVDELTAYVKSIGIRAAPYHAGMRDEDRTRVQDRFASDQLDVVVATVAFGMGIDRSDIRFVIHAGMPKSLEHYQQETGRAGRDGEPADCILFISRADFFKWRGILKDSPDLENHMRLLNEMNRFCTGGRCRHRTLVEYFGQKWERDSCEACDVCSGTMKTLPNARILVQKILSCVIRTGQCFGAGHVSDVLRGSKSARVKELRHVVRRRSR